MNETPPDAQIQKDIEDITRHHTQVLAIKSEILGSDDAQSDAETTVNTDMLRLAKPFILLAGILGMGKTPFEREQARLIVPHLKNYCLVSVRPDLLHFFANSVYEFEFCFDEDLVDLSYVPHTLHPLTRINAQLLFHNRYQKALLRGQVDFQNHVGRWTLPIRYKLRSGQLVDALALLAECFDGRLGGQRRPGAALPVVVVKAF